MNAAARETNETFVGVVESSIPLEQNILDLRAALEQRRTALRMLISPGVDPEVRLDMHTVYADYDKTIRDLMSKVEKIMVDA